MNKYDSILCLKKPKLLKYTAVNNRGKTLANLKSSINHSSFIDKIDKKNKSSHSVIDFPESKKSKIKQKKKTRGRLYIGEDTSIVADNLGSDVASGINFIRASKSSKNKKGVKSKNPHIDTVFTEENSGTNEIYLSDLLTVQDLADKLHVPSADIIKWLFLQGISATINQLLDISTSTLVAEHYSFTVLKNTVKDCTLSKLKRGQNGKSRAPVITLLGHVDHGKTALLRAIRQDSSMVQEAGNITQAIGSYEVLIDNDPVVTKLIFLDTPGHEAFAGMRERGANITDLVLLVVAADDGLKPQTIEAISYIQARSLPVVVAINKIDKTEADLDKVRNQLSALGITDRNIDGYSVIVGVSALNHSNIDSLLSSIIALSKSQNLKSDPSVSAEGAILESYLDKQRGPVAQLLVQNGTLAIGDVVVAGNFYGRVKAINDSLSRKVKSIESVSVASILCFTQVPSAGLFFKVVDDEKMAKALVSSSTKADHFTALNSRISLDDASPKSAKKIVKQVNLIIKTAAQGSIDAIMRALSCLPQEKVQINLLLAASGEVSLKDIELAYTSNSLILAFGLHVLPTILRRAEKRGVAISLFNVIYDLIDYVESRMLQFVDIDYEKQILGSAEVKNLFAVNKGIVAGCFIESGKLKKKSQFQVRRGGQNIYSGFIDSIKRIKEDVDEVSEGNECGVMCKDYNYWEIGDLLECYDLKPLEKAL